MEKLTVIETAEDPPGSGTWSVLLSDGTMRRAKQAPPIGAEWMEETPAAEFDRQIIVLDFSKQPGFVEIGYTDRGGDTHEYFELIADDLRIVGMTPSVLAKLGEPLAAELADANAALAALSETNGKLAEEILNLKHRPAMMKAPPSLLHVHTRNIDDLVSLDALTPAETMPAPEGEVDTRTDVEKHLDAKRRTIDEALAPGAEPGIELEVTKVA